MDDLAAQVAALAERLGKAEAQLATLLAPRPRAAPVLGVDGAIRRVTCTDVHRGGRSSLHHHRHCCVYALVGGDAAGVVYVGRSRVGFGSRVNDHEDKCWSRVVVADLRIGSGVLADAAFHALECALVLHFSPLHNVAPLSGSETAASLWPASPVFARIVSSMAGDPPRVVPTSSTGEAM